MKRNKGLSIFWKIIICATASLAVITLVLGLIPLKNAPELTKTDALTSIEIYTGGTSKLHLNKTDTPDNFNKVTKAYNDTKYFTVLRGILVGEVSGMQLTPDDEDVDDDRYNKDQINALVGDASEYMVVFKYDSIQTTTIKGEKFEYNRAKVLITDTDGEIGEFTIALYDTDKFFVPVNGPGDEKYDIRLIKAKGKCFKLFDTIDDLLA